MGMSKKMGSKKDVGRAQSMPNEMLEKIFSFLPLESKKTARLVCRRWCRILNYHGLILNVQLTDKSISSAKYFTQPHLNSLTVKKLTQDIYTVYGSTNVVPPTISKLIVSDGIPYPKLVNVLKYYKPSNIKELEFRSFSLSLTGIDLQNLAASLTKWSFLKILKLSAEPHSKPPYSSGEVITQLTKSSATLAEVLKHICIPSLATLSLYLDSGSRHHLYLNESRKHPFESIYTQMTTFLHRHVIYDKFKCLELKWVGGFPGRAQFPPKLWSKSMAQLDSLKLDLVEYNYDYMIGLLRTQRQVKHIETESLDSDLLNKLLANNSTTIESIIINGHAYKVSFPPVFTNLKCLSIGFHDLYDLRKFLETIQLSSSRITPTSAFPSLVTFNLIDTHFLIEKSQLLQDDGTFAWKPQRQKPTEHVFRILELILTTFPSLAKLGFLIRGDSTKVSEIKSAAKGVLYRVQNLKTMSITINDANHGYFTNGLKVKKEIKLSCNLMMPLKKSSAAQYYERGVAVTFQELKSTTQLFSTMSPNQNQRFSQPSRPLF